MKFSSPISFSKKGLYFKNSRYRIFFPWGNPFKYHLIDVPQVTIPYENSSKLKGMSYEDIISEWVLAKHRNNHIVVLTNINVQAKNIQFWAKVPTTDMVHFVKDIVILHCTDKTEVSRLVENIPSNFADAIGYSAGTLVINNKDI